MILKNRVPIGFLFGKIKWDLLITFGFVVLVNLAHDWLTTFELNFSISVFLGTAISLVLSFKLSHSYDRWWEARKVWGAIVNDSRTLVVQTLTFVGAKERIEEIQRLAYRQIGWCFVLGESLRKLDTAVSLAKFLSKVDQDVVARHNNKPLAIVQLHGLDIKRWRNEGIISDFEQIQLDNTLVRLVDSMGKAERIKNTVFPESYRIALHIFIYLFLIVLSIIMSSLNIYVEVPVLVAISIPFFLLEKIAINIQDPFENQPTDTPMTSLAHTIEVNIRQLMGEVDIPAPPNNDLFYIL